ncbi:hypothetical protein KY284_019192 [Solanum tuberosum]|nr:hypothetical protein KY284_019192 [Solanum tuberosum]
MIPDSKRVDADIEDRFSALPRNLVDDILRLLPVHDAARTRVQLCSYADIDRWMLYVTRYGVKELTLFMSKNINSTYKVPSYIFNCRTLTQLKLFNCIFKLPNSFLGFQTLTILQLKEVTFAPAIEFYAIKTPLLVKLILTHCDGTQYLNIEFSSGLKCLSVRTVPKGLHYTLNCLWHLKLGVNFNKLGQTCYTLELIKSFPNLSKLEIWDNAFGDPDEAAMKYLDTPSCTQCLKFVVSSRLKVLVVRYSRFGVDLSCFTNCKDLKHLYLVSTNPIRVERSQLGKLLSSAIDSTTSDNVEVVLEYLNSSFCLNQPLHGLKDVVMHAFEGSKVEMLFVKLLFARTPSLIRMQVNVFDLEKGREIATELMDFPRASPKAELFCTLCTD